jgi:Lrp/AsnC family transcriptional regulator for asnA, asnC and gidA
MEKYELDALDYKILNLISNDARISFLEVSRICNISGAAVHQRVQKMIANNIITGSEFRLNLSMTGYNTCAFLELHFAESEDIDAIIEQLTAIPEIVECHSTIGEYDLIIKIYAHNNPHLHEIIKHQIKPLGLVRMKSTISCKELFHRQITFEAKQ